MLAKYKNLNRHLLDREIARFAATFPADALVLDLGAGSGHYRRLFTKPRYLAVDRGYEQESFEGLDVVADVNSTPFDDNSADGILCAEVLEHLPEPDRLLSEAARILRPGGRLLLTVPLCYGEHMLPHDYYRYTRVALQAMLQKHGFSPIRTETRGGYFSLLAYLLGRLPDQPGLRRFKPMLRLLFTYLIAPAVNSLDHLDSKKTFTLGFMIEVTKPEQSVDP